MNAVCRAVTFISYHIPLMEDMGEMPQYSTIGFFDGMFTEKLDVEYGKNDLKKLWKYNIKKTAESKGRFSYQNIFCFSEDCWNHYTDTEFWQEMSDFEYPLLFVVFLQLSDYMTDDTTIERQCVAFNNILRDRFGKEGKYYTYGTIDKNDFVVCIRSRNHKQTVEAIKKLHGTESSVVYSYSVLSVANRVLDSIDEHNYPYLFEQFVDSICLKGITNSFNPCRSITLDQRYYEFCDRLVDRFYPTDEKNKPKKERLYRIYDILGDDDFRLIAREVNLGKLLREFKPKGQLGYFQSDLRFYLYSSSLVLNTMTPSSNMAIGDNEKKITVQQMNEKMKSPICEKLQNNMEKIVNVLKYDMVDEKKVTFCQSLWQLLQSLKVLESAPTKKYDFYSLYHPFSALVRILEGKMEQKELGSNDEIYEFIHKISMTLHGTLRTDIQFFQIRDFNVIVHYAPAKLRAFYAIWALKLSEFYNSFEHIDKKYSFILAPGVFGETHVKQLFVRHDETERLMLITTPERNLYAPRWLAVIIAHEVSHYVGTKIRERMFRHKVVLRVSAYILALELEKLWYIGMPTQLKAPTEKMIGKSTYLCNQLKKELARVDREINKASVDNSYQYHSDISRETIRKDYRYLTDTDIDRMLISEYGELLKNFLKKEVKDFVSPHNLDICNEREAKVLKLFEKFQQIALPDLLQMLLNYICAETFADMIAILTLELSPEEYVTSFVRNQILDYNQDPDRESISLFTVRLAAVIQSVRKIVNKNKEWLENQSSKLTEDWKGDVISEAIFRFGRNTREQDIMIMVYGYIKELRVKQDSISGYKSIYNPENSDGTFSGCKFDFVNDKNVFNLLVLYLFKCADTYIKQLKSDEKLCSIRREKLSVYRALACESVTDMMQAVENFLHEHEKGLADEAKS